MELPTAPSTSLTNVLQTPVYHESLRDHMKAAEPELWNWFAEAERPSGTEVDLAELELLKMSYRLDGAAHGELVGYAVILAAKLGLNQTIVLYQELQAGNRNASVLQLEDTIHIVFGGDLLDLLDGDEQQAVLAHELAHVALWERDQRDFHILDHLIHRLESEPLASDAIRETARRLRLHSEVWADAVALEIAGDLDASIRAIVKVSAGLQNVDAGAYLRQARQILESDPTASRGWTHPELHVRVACLAAQKLSEANSVVSEFIGGPDDLDRLDVFGQLRVQELTARVLSCGQAVALSLGVDADPVHQHVSDFEQLPRPTKSPLDDGALSDKEPSVRYLCGALLVDLALLGEGLGTPLDQLQSFSLEASRLGVSKEFDKVLGRATKKTAAELRKLRTLS